MSREAWGDAPAQAPECCPNCGSSFHMHGCPLCDMDKRRIAAEAEATRLRARVLELEAVHEDASGAILADRERIKAAVHRAVAQAENCEGDGPEVDTARKALACTILAAIAGYEAPPRADTQPDLFAACG